MGPDAVLWSPSMMTVSHGDLLYIKYIHFFSRYSPSILYVHSFGANLSIICLLLFASSLCAPRWCFDQRADVCGWLVPDTFHQEGGDVCLVPSIRSERPPLVACSQYLCSNQAVTMMKWNSFALSPSTKRHIQLVLVSMCV